MTTLHAVNWTAYRMAQARLPLSDQIFATKLLIKWLPTGSRLSKMGKQVTTCPLCDDIETNEHLFSCPHRCDDNRTMLHRFDSFLRKIQTATCVRQAMISGLETHLQTASTKNPTPEESSPVPDTDTDRCAATCGAIQTKVGWHSLMSGLIADEWCRWQEKLGGEKQSNPRLPAEDISVLKRPENPQGRKANTSGDTWGSQVVSFLILEAKTRWHARNELIHAPEPSTTADEAQATRRPQTGSQHL
jgi:hypothetical protein